MENRNDEIVICQKRIAAFLLLCNCDLVNVNTDLKDPNRVVFFFKRSKRIDNFLQSYSKNKVLLNEILDKVKSL